MRKKGKIFGHLEIFWFEYSGRFIEPPKLLCSPTAMIACAQTHKRILYAV